jgi:hypothetical protein
MIADDSPSAWEDAMPAVVAILQVVEDLLIRFGDMFPNESVRHTFLLFARLPNAMVQTGIGPLCAVVSLKSETAGAFRLP